MTSDNVQTAPTPTETIRAAQDALQRLLRDPELAEVMGAWQRARLEAACEALSELMARIQQEED
jgi:hypothetical protein